MIVLVAVFLLFLLSGVNLEGNGGGQEGEGDTKSLYLVTMEVVIIKVADRYREL